MSSIFIDGFDHYDSHLLKWDAAGNGVTNLDFVSGRFGGQAVANANTGNSDGLIKNFGSSETEIYCGFAFKADTFTDSFVTEYLVRFRNSTDGISFSARYGESGEITLHLSDGVSVLATSALGVLTEGLWHYVEFRYKPLNSGGVCTVWVDNTQVLTYSGDTTVSEEAVDALQILPTVANFGQGIVRVDDLYILNTSGTEMNTRTGESRILTNLPTADTTQRDFSPSSGTDNYAMVDEFPTIDEDTTYVENGTSGATDRYTSDSLATSGTIHTIQVNTCARKTDTDTRKFRNSILSNSTKKEDTAEHTVSTNYFIYPDPYDVDPSTGVAWTESADNALKFGFKLTTVI